MRQTQEKPLRRYLTYIEAVAQTAYIVVRLQTAIEDTALRRDDRRTIWNVLRRRPNPFVLQAYAIKSIAYYHDQTLISSMTADGHLINMF